MPTVFTAASLTAAEDSSIAMTWWAESARSTANVPTPAYASTSSSLPLSWRRSATSVARCSACGVLTCANDGDAMRRRRSSICSQ